VKTIGVLGGTFDPIHIGHLILAEEVRDRAALDRVLLVPAARAPHKARLPEAPASARLRMAEVAVEGHERFEVSPLEIERGGISYTLDTVSALLELHPDAELAFLLGADGLPDLPSWHRVDHLLERVRFLIATRPGYALSAFDELVPALGERIVNQLRRDAVEIPPIGVSSTEIRERVRAGRSVRFLVPPGVERVIEEHGLYR
jgi:nicotinate-nucleotide adenylyltransferase